MAQLAEHPTGWRPGFEQSRIKIAAAVK